MHPQNNVHLSLSPLCAINCHMLVQLKYTKSLKITFNAARSVQVGLYISERTPNCDVKAVACRFGNL